jgi:CBS domain-containing protein
LSPRAAWRLEGLGFTRVLDYVPGKVDWLAYGLPVEPEEFERSLVKGRMLREFPRCLPGEPLSEARARARIMASDVCPVVNEARILLGVLGAAHWDGDLERRAEEVMQPGPTTVRPSLSISEAEEMLAEGKQDVLWVTSADGRLMGIFRRGR